MKELILILLTIFFIGLLNCQFETFEVKEDNSKNNSKSKIESELKSKSKSDLDSDSGSDSENELDNKSVTIQKSSKKKSSKKKSSKISSKKKDLKNTNNINEINKREKYYDYNYTFNQNEERERPININVSYPPPYQPPSTDNPSYYNTTLIRNLAGTPADQVQTEYSVIDDNRYKSWDDYYLPGYSYFPPSKWQLPRDNSYLVPKDLVEEKCNVCPLISNNGTDNYLSGDILKGYTNKNIIQNEIDETDESETVENETNEN